MLLSFAPICMGTTADGGCATSCHQKSGLHGLCMHWERSRICPLQITAVAT